MKNIDDRLDKVWSQIVRLLNPFCWFPGCGQPSTDACHIFNRRHRTTRWLTKNGLGGCRKHHSWEETHPKEAEKMIRAKIGSHQYEQLRKLAMQEAHLTESDKKDLYKSLLKLLKSLPNYYG